MTSCFSHVDVGEHVDVRRPFVNNGELVDERTSVNKGELVDERALIFPFVNERHERGRFDRYRVMRV